MIMHINDVLDILQKYCKFGIFREDVTFAKLCICEDS